MSLKGITIEDFVTTRGGIWTGQRAMQAKDSDLMPFGKYKGEKLGDVPASYFMWLDNEGCSNTLIRSYIEKNRDYLKKEAENER